MSEDNKKLIENREEEKKKKINFWKSQKNVDIYNLFINGATIMDIAEKIKIKPTSVETILTHRFFIQRLENHMRGLMFAHQVSGVIAKADIFQRLWDKVRDNMADIAPEICLKELTKLLPRKREGLIINPKNMNVFMKVMGESASPEDIGAKLRELPEGRDALDFEPLDETGDEDYDGLNNEDNEGIEQGDPGMDPEKSDQDQ